MIEDLYQKYLQCSSVTTDSRKVPDNSLFFALKGPNFNANKFADDALSKGAKYAVIDDPSYKKDDRYILVEDALTALQKLANHHRHQLKIPIIGITGSNGKTTTKELVHGVLKQKYNTFATPGNLNNHIGVPLSLLVIDDTIEIAVIEMGANKVGDIKELCDIAEPTHGLITNIGKAHIEGFGGFEGVLRAKTELYQHLIANGGQVFINSQNDVLSNMKKRFENPLMYPAQEDFFNCELIEADPFVIYRHENGEQVNTHLMGAYNFENIATALCIGKFFEVPAEKANQSIAGYQAKNNRSEIIKLDSITILMDAYNANPTSMEAAINNFAQMKKSPKMVILGDMFELGDTATEEHHSLGKLVKDLNFEKTIFCGSEMKHAKEAYSEALYFEEKVDLINYLKNAHYKDYYILIKASRGMALEDILPHLKE